MVFRMKNRWIISIVLFFGLTANSWAKVKTEYYGDGTILSTQIYYANGTPKGPNKFYWPNGKLRMETFFKKGELIKTLRWTDDGQRCG